MKKSIVFIKNIQAKLQEGRKGKEGEDEINLQMILSSHSSHIVSQSDFEKIKFFLSNFRFFVV